MKSEQSVIPVNMIDAPEDMNVRTTDPKVKSLVESIRVRGLLQPIVVEKNGGERFTLVSGFRRFAAIQSLNWKEVPATVRTYAKATTALERAVDNILENQEREDVHPLDIARRATELVKGGYPVKDGEKADPVDKKEVCRLTGWGMTHLNNMVRAWSNLDDDVAALCLKHQVPLRAILEWVAIPYEKGSTEEETNQNRFEVQHAAFSAWLDTQTKLAEEGRKRKPREKSAKGAKGDGDGEGSGSGVDAASMVNKTKTAMLQNYILVLRQKADETKDAKERERIEGRIEALRHVTGDLKRMPGVTQSDLNALKAALNAPDDEEGEDSE